MDSIALGLAAFRKYFVDGVPSSGANKPSETDIRAWITAMGTEIDTTASRSILANG